MNQKTKWSITTEIIIKAPANLVWNILTHLPAYSRWNPFLIEAAGEIKKGSRLRNSIRTGNGVTTFRPVVLTADAPHYFDWMGVIGHRSVFAGRHAFQLESIAPDQVKLTHSECFSGLLAGIIFRKICKETRQGFVQMNQALKTEAEKLFQQTQNQS